MHCLYQNTVYVVSLLQKKWKQNDGRGYGLVSCVAYCMIVSATGTDCIKLHNEEHHNPYSSANMIQLIKSHRWDGQDMLYILGEEKCTQGFDLKERDNLGDLGVDGRYWNVSYRNRMGSCTGLICLSMCKGGGLMWTRRWTYVLRKMWRIS